MSFPGAVTEAPAPEFTGIILASENRRKSVLLPNESFGQIRNHHYWSEIPSVGDEGPEP